ncbi:uncharacterized protein [Dermacentor albipictus]|uniref:uncharacterized protein n=1 Tax=Dermacentor albipictus TaxID=60249 RepID=UPI0038FD167C
MTRPDHPDMTSAPPLGYISHADGEHIRGHGGTFVSTTMNPLLLFVQVTLWTASIPVRNSSDNTTTIADAQDHVLTYGRRAFMTRPDHPDMTSAPPLGYISHADGEHIRGHGGTFVSTTMNPLLLFVQVGVQRSSICLRSDNRFIIVLPCPAVCLSLIDEAWNVLLLLLAGDVEVNPGPSGIELMLKNMQETLQASITSVSVSQTSLEKTMNDRFDKLNDVLTVIAKHTEQLDQLRSEVNSLKETIHNQQKKLNDLEDRSRRRNLIIFGLEEPTNESAGDLRKRVLDDIFCAKLGVTTNTVERIHRIGRISDKPRPVLLNFFDYNEKVSVLKNCFKLKKTGISICHDYCKATLTKRSHLWRYGKQFKDEARKISLDYDRLRVDDNIYEWDEVSWQVVALHKSRSTRTSN